MNTNQNQNKARSIGLGIAIVSIFATAPAQVDQIATRLMERERSLMGHTISWHLDESVTLYARRDVGDPGAVGVTFNYDDQSWKRATKFTIVRDGDSMVVTGESAVFNAAEATLNKKPLMLLYADQTVGAARFTDPTDFSTMTLVEFVGTSGFGAKSSNAIDTSAILWPHDYLLLAGLAPKGVFGMTWSYSTNPDGSVVARGTNYDSELRVLNTNLKNHWDIEVVYDAQRLCPVALTTRQEGKVEHQYEITGMIEAAGVWLPKEVKMTHRLGSDARPMSDSVRKWTFESIEPADGASFPIRKDTRVVDWRLDTKDLHLWLFPPKGAEPVLYKWQGRLPTLDELRSIRDGEPVDIAERSTPAWIWPTTLIGIGCLWMFWVIGRKSKVRRRSS